MLNAVVINGSPRQSKGNTALVLEPFLEGLRCEGANVRLYYASQLKVKPCSCGNLYCWTRTPGECIHKDSMQVLYPVLKESQIVVLATPIYNPLPGDMQNFINRLIPLLDPQLQFTEGRTRARLRGDVHIEKFVLVSTGGWWERANVDTLQRIVEELAVVANVKFGGAIVRPHAYAMRRDGKMTDAGKKILTAITRAAKELIQEGAISAETEAEISQPLISQEDFFAE